MAPFTHEHFFHIFLLWYVPVTVRFISQLNHLNAISYSERYRHSCHIPQRKLKVQLFPCYTYFIWDNTVCTLTNQNQTNPKKSNKRPKKSLKNIKGWDGQRYLRQKRVPLHWCLEEDKKVLSQKQVPIFKEALIPPQNWARVQSKEQDWATSKNRLNIKQ